jgi:Ni/Co efflux regulator RcnB
MKTRYTKPLIALAAVGAIAVPTVAQARGGSDDPPNHEAQHHRTGDDARRDRLERHHHHRGHHDRHDGRGTDDGPNHT